jgi:hypothetical protein|tara:strand:- start:20340 stop:21023 length:684 start_codon:yes stop_codon:yes gene_type:complete
MVNIDTVYQKVLALANKEQRGYITPQEFNLFADKAQKEIIDQYFYDINQFGRTPGNSTEYSDMLELLDEKLSALKDSSTETVTNGSFQLGVDVYRIGSIIDGDIEIEPINYNEHKLRNLSPLTKPTLSRPVYVNTSNTINVYPNSITSVFLSYIKKPTKPQWGYVVVNDKPLYNSDSNVSQNFELHPSEESELVYRILALAGVAIEKPQLTQVAVGLEGAKVQQEKQ